MIARSPIRVLLVDDSLPALTVLQRLLAAVPDMEVVGTARSGRDALEMIPRLQPDVLCADLRLAVMDGAQLTREVMTRCPRPILVIGDTMPPDDGPSVFPVLDAGAVDVTVKPSSHAVSEAEAQEFVRRIRIVAGVKVFTRRQRPAPAPPRVEVSPHGAAPAGLVVIGASTGGPQALLTVLSHLPAHFPAPVLCIQHISRGFLDGLVDWLQARCALKLRVAEGGETAQVGSVYFAPEDRHLEIDSHQRLILSDAPPLRGHRPSATVTLRSAAQRLGSAMVGVLLTGMGSDGADGMRAVADAGGQTLVQDEATSVVFGMPREAIALGAAQRVLPLDQIGPALVAAVVRRRTEGKG